jgi:hypothetical protein
MIVKMFRAIIVTAVADELPHDGPLTRALEGRKRLEERGVATQRTFRVDRR